MADQATNAFVCPLGHHQCLCEDCPAFWWEGIIAGCSLEETGEDIYPVEPDDYED